jgi:hypothetical protein
VSLLYLYGFVPAGATLPDGGLLGVDDAEVEIVPVGGFGAVVGRVSDTEYGPDRVEGRADDLEWMAAQGLRHEQVVAWFVDHGSILPARLLTVFSSEDALRDRLSSQASGIAERLRRFDGLREWDLKISYDATVLADHLGEVSVEIAALDREIDAASPGRRFLLKRKREDLARTETRSAARRLAGDVLDRIQGHARDLRRLDPPMDDAPVISYIALLVDRRDDQTLLEALATAADPLRTVGVDARLTGPWAPYRFMDEAS